MPKSPGLLNRASRGGKNARRFFTGLLFLTLPLGFVEADKAPVTIEAAQALEKADKTDQATAVYEEWLKDHTTDPRFPAVLIHCSELKKNPRAAIILLASHVDKIQVDAVKNDISKRIGMLYSLMGEYQNALVFLGRAYKDITAKTVEDPWMIKTVFLSIETGELADAYEWIRKFNPVIKSPVLRADLNYALLEIYLAQDDAKNAQRAFAILRDQFATSPAWPRALARMCVVALSLGSREKADEYLSVLKKDFPGSLEERFAVAAYEGRSENGIVFVSTPHELFRMVGPDEIVPDATSKPDDSVVQKDPAVEEQAISKPDETPTAAQRYSIQVGSYTMKENAEYMIRDLKKLSFAAEITEVVVQGKTYFQVLVGKGLNEAESQTMLARLRDKGIGGYLVSSPL